MQPHKLTYNSKISLDFFGIAAAVQMSLRQGKSSYVLFSQERELCLMPLKFAANNFSVFRGMAVSLWYATSTVRKRCSYVDTTFFVVLIIHHSFTRID